MANNSTQPRIPGRPRGRPRKDGSPPRQSDRTAYPIEEPIPDPTGGATPTTYDRFRAAELAGLGLPFEDIAALVGCQISDLVGNGVLANDCKVGVAQANEALARKVRDKAFSGNPAIMNAYAKSRLRWNDTGAREPEPSEQITEIEWTVYDGKQQSNARKNKAPARAVTDTIPKAHEQSPRPSSPHSGNPEAEDSDAPVDDPTSGACPL